MRLKFDPLLSGIEDYKLLQDCTGIEVAKEVLGTSDIRVLAQVYKNASKKVLNILGKQIKEMFEAYLQVLNLVKPNSKGTGYSKGSIRNILKQVDKYDLLSISLISGVRFKYGVSFDLTEADREKLIEVMNSCIEATIAQYKKQLEDIYISLDNACKAEITKLKDKAERVHNLLGLNETQSLSSDGMILHIATNTIYEGIEDETEAFNKAYHLYAQMGHTDALDFVYSEAELDAMLGLLTSSELKKEAQIIRDAQARLLQKYVQGVAKLGEDGKLSEPQRDSLNRLRVQKYT